MAEKEYIEREAAYPIAQKIVNAITNVEYHAGVFAYDIMDWIDDIPPADVRPVVRGHWEWDENGMDWGLGAWKCSECKAIPQTWWNADKANPLRCSGSRFCGNCGADMREVKVDG